jgi:hypothetical protein
MGHIFAPGQPPVLKYLKSLRFETTQDPCDVCLWPLLLKNQSIGSDVLFHLLLSPFQPPGSSLLLTYMNILLKCRTTPSTFVFWPLCTQKPVRVGGCFFFLSFFCSWSYIGSPGSLLSGQTFSFGVNFLNQRNTVRCLFLACEYLIRPCRTLCIFSLRGS